MKQLTVLGAIGIGAILSLPAQACSICRCGDPTFNALGKEGIAQTGLRLAVDWDQVEKTQGSLDDAFDELHEQRITLLAAYAVSDRVNLFARVPYSQRELTETEEGESERTRHSGLADPEIYGQVQLWASQFDGAVGIRSAIFGVAGVKTNWGENDASHDGERLDEHVQPGTGSTDWFAGLSGSYQIDPHSAVFASAQYRHTGRNDFGYRYGRVELFNVAYEHKLGTRWDAVLEANYRWAQHDQVDSFGTLDPDTGGSIMYLTPRLLFDAGHGWVLRASAQLPLSDSGLNGAQDEKAVVNFGITYLMNR
jgi:hypothetical protein